MAFHLRFTMMFVVIFGCCGFLLSVLLLAPFYFSSKWSEKFAIEKAIIKGLPCFGAVSGFIIGRKAVPQLSSNSPAGDQQSNGQQNSESTEPRAVPHFNPDAIPRNPIIMSRLIQGMVVLSIPHARPYDLEAQVMANGQRTSDTFNMGITLPEAPAPTAHNSRSWTTDSLRNSEPSPSLSPYTAQDLDSGSSPSLPPYTAQDPENPTVPAPSYSRYDGLSRPPRENGLHC